MQLRNTYCFTFPPWSIEASSLRENAGRVGWVIPTDRRVLAIHTQCFFEGKGKG